MTWTYIFIDAKFSMATIGVRKQHSFFKCNKVLGRFIRMLDTTSHRKALMT